MEYRVTWIIDLDAASHKEAAKEALRIQRDQGSDALIFEVEDLKTGETNVIDLLCEMESEESE